MILVDDLDDSGAKVVRSIPGHRAILAAGSSFFRDIFESCQGNSGSVYLGGMSYKPVNVLILLRSSEMYDTSLDGSEWFPATVLFIFTEPFVSSNTVHW